MAATAPWRMPGSDPDRRAKAVATVGGRLQRCSLSKPEPPAQELCRIPGGPLRPRDLSCNPVITICRSQQLWAFSRACLVRRPQRRRALEEKAPGSPLTRRGPSERRRSCATTTPCTRPASSTSSRSPRGSTASPTWRNSPIHQAQKANACWEPAAQVGFHQADALSKCRPRRAAPAGEARVALMV